MNTLKGGLKEYIKSDKDLKLGGIFNQPTLSEVPLEFSMQGVTWQKNQGNTDECAAASSTGAREVQEEVEMDYDFIFALAKSLEGDIDSWGVSLDNMAKAWVKFGCIERKDRPKELEEVDSNYLRKIENWPNLPQLLVKASVHKAKSYMKTSGRYDPFDNIKTWAWKFRAEKRLSVFGINWGFAVSDVYIDRIAPDGSGHAVRLDLLGFKYEYGKEWMVIRNSYGAECGQNGVQYLSRAVVNEGVNRYGGMMFQDYTPDEIREMIAKGYKADSSLIQSLFRRALTLLKELLGMKQKELADLGAPPSKWLLPALIWQESGGDDFAVGDNGNAQGCLQIWDSYFFDAFGRRGAKECLGNRALSIKAFERYMSRYATEKWVGKPITDEIIARIHNGGPRGYKNPNTLIYWSGVKRKLEALQQGKVSPALLEKLTKNI